MSTVRRPVGPLPPQVYWTRRLMVLGALVVVVALLWAMLAGGGGTAAADDDADGTAEESGEAGGDGATSGARTCTAEDLTLAVTADARAYPEGATPVFTVTIRNAGETSCVVDAGDASRELLITSGSDRIWSSTDCPPEDAERALLLPAGTTDEATVTWSRERSDAACTEGLPTPRPGTYRAVVTLVGAESEPVVFDLG